MEKVERMEPKSQITFLQTFAIDVCKILIPNG
ncbi:MAG: hypothetical protein BWZ11_01449 [Bacteroidetes bacterium ADurb.BinA395]|jgi:hypothetical protein|nr:MAG: hypothetical protein BWZ11_01449 [Bacteroidetes bacterium ADurb.BinA395]